MSIRHCERSEAIHLQTSQQRQDGLPRRRCLLAMTALLLLSGCIFVDDFGHAWQDSTPDTCLNKMAESLYATEFRRDPTGVDMSQIEHGWDMGGQHYLLMKQSPEDKGGRLYRFTVVHGIFQRWRLDPTMREEFAREYPNAPVSIKRDTVTIDSLNPETEKLLAEVANQPEYWQIEEQTLYNVVRNPACRYDDRPPEDEKPKPIGKK